MLDAQGWEKSVSRPGAGSQADATTAAMVRVAIASFFGTVIEFYDFNIYGTAAALVFPSVFFPALGPVAGTVASFAALGVAFVARPFGAILFGHFGDRLGRKRTLVTTLLIMGVATMLVGLTPTAAQIGVAAPILIVLLRIVQGLAAGGEWAGAALFASENAPKAQRGIWAMFPSFGGGIAIVLASGTFLLTGLAMSNETFTNWGWRIPFLASIILVFVGMYVRLKVDETPVFKDQVARRGAARVPFIEAFTRQPRHVLLGAGVEIMAFAFVYLGGTYLINYGTSVLQLDRSFVLTVGIVGGLTLSLAIVLSAGLSDRIGRRRVLLVASSVAVVWGLVLFSILDTRSALAFAVGVVVTMFISGLAFGPAGAFLSEMFHTRYRYTAAGVSYTLAGIVGGAIPPLVATAIIATSGAFVFGLFLAALCLISLVSCLALSETRNYELVQVAAGVTA